VANESKQPVSEGAVLIFGLLNLSFIRSDGLVEPSILVVAERLKVFQPFGQPDVIPGTVEQGKLSPADF
jgi:hypothetical protein